MEENYELIKFYLQFLRISRSELADICNISPITISSWNTKKNIPKDKLDKILKYINEPDIDSLLQKAIYYQNQIKQLPILVEYLKILNISYEEIALKFNTSPENVYSILSGRIKISKKQFDILLEIIDEKDLSSINEKINTFKNNVKYLKMYLKKEKISMQKLTNSLNISLVSINNLFSEKKLSVNIYNKILAYLEIDDFNKFVEQMNLHNENLNNLPYLVRYLKIKNINRAQIAENIKISVPTINNWLSRKAEISDDYINKILAYLNETSLNSVKDYVIEYDAKNVKSDNKNTINIVYLKKYLEIMSITSSKIANKLGLNKNFVSEWLSKDFLEQEYLELILKVLNKSIDEIEKEVREYEEELKDIIYLKQLLRISNKNYETIIDYLHVTSNNLTNWLNGKKLIPKNELRSLLSLVNVPSLEEAKRKVNNSEQQKKNIFMDKEIKKQKEYNSIKNNLRNNLVFKYRIWKIEDIIYEKAINYSYSNKKANEYHFDACCRYIENYVLTNVNNNDNFKNIVYSIYDSYIAFFSTQYNISYNLLFNIKEKVISLIIKDNRDINFIKTILKKYILLYLKNEDKLIDNELFKSIIKKDIFNDDEKTILNLLYGSCGKYYSIDEIKKETQFNNELIIETQKKFKKEYKNLVKKRKKLYNFYYKGN